MSMTYSCHFTLAILAATSLLGCSSKAGLETTSAVRKENRESVKTSDDSYSTSTRATATISNPNGPADATIESVCAAKFYPLFASRIKYQIGASIKSITELTAPLVLEHVVNTKEEQVYRTTLQPGTLAAEFLFSQKDTLSGVVLMFRPSNAAIDFEAKRTEFVRELGEPQSDQVRGSSQNPVPARAVTWSCGSMLVTLRIQKPKQGEPSNYFAALTDIRYR
jgi:hypothetical protein